jgi:hypothetical protein
MRRSTVSKQKDCTADDYISRLEAVVRAADELGQDAAAVQVGCGHYGLTLRTPKKTFDERARDYWNARARVTLPPLTQTTQAKDVDKEDASDGN